mmetsp:Transcript_25023/g.57837  ORF Transcript_25023/g.57837 Transcript_25023/m.57837 type:complete len:208 (+) Transcript_25023:5668-6291(+)
MTTVHPQGGKHGRTRHALGPFGIGHGRRNVHPKIYRVARHVRLIVIGGRQRSQRRPGVDPRRPQLHPLLRRLLRLRPVIRPVELLVQPSCRRRVVLLRHPRQHPPLERLRRRPFRRQPLLPALRRLGKGDGDRPRASGAHVRSGAGPGGRRSRRRSFSAGTGPGGRGRGVVDVERLAGAGVGPGLPARREGGRIVIAGGAGGDGKRF